MAERAKTPPNKRARAASGEPATDGRSPSLWFDAPIDDPDRRPQLTRQRVVAEALAVIAQDGVQAMSMRALAARRGRQHDPETEEQPGRILHEDRPAAPDWLVEAGWPVREGALRYYGTSDATSWWLVVLDAVGDPGLVEELADGLPPSWVATQEKSSVLGTSRGAPMRSRGDRLNPVGSASG